jgi:hypothetical protein
LQENANVYSQVSEVTAHMIGLWRNSAKILLYHFSVILQGMVPFSPFWNPEKQKQVKLDEDSIDYIQKILLDRSKFKLLFSFQYPRLRMVLTFSSPLSDAEFTHLQEENLDNL